MSIATLQRRIAGDLEKAGQGSPYAADADEPDPRYKGYGVRAPAMRDLIKRYRSDFKALSTAETLDLARRLIKSGYGEQKTVALHLLEQIADYFTPARFDELETLVAGLHGWSKIDHCAGGLLRLILERYPAELLKLLGRWNQSRDMWLRRASVVVFTRKVALSGKYTDTALSHCEHLKFDTEDLVRKGVGWTLKDLMRSERERVLRYVISLREQGVSSVITLYALRDIKGKERERVLAHVAPI